MMTHKWIFILLLLVSMAGNAQERKYSTFYYQRATLFEELPVTSKDIIFLGNMTSFKSWRFQFCRYFIQSPATFLGKYLS